MAGDGSFKVDLNELSDATTQVQGVVANNIDPAVADFKRNADDAAEAWKSPAGNTFVGLITNYNSVTTSLTDLLNEAIGRMQSSLANYTATEGTNAANLQ